MHSHSQLLLIHQTDSGADTQLYFYRAFLLKVAKSKPLSHKRPINNTASLLHVIWGRKVLPHIQQHSLPEGGKIPGIFPQTLVICNTKIFNNNFFKAALYLLTFFTCYLGYMLSQRLCNGIFVPGHRTNNLQVACDCLRMGSNYTMITNSSFKKSVIKTKTTHFIVRLGSSSSFPTYSDRQVWISSHHPTNSKEERSLTPWGDSTHSLLRLLK